MYSYIMSDVTSCNSEHSVHSFQCWINSQKCTLKKGMNAKSQSYNVLTVLNMSGISTQKKVGLVPTERVLNPQTVIPGAADCSWTLYNLYLILHQCSDVAGLPSRCGAHIQDPLSGTRPEDVSHHHRGKVLHNTGIRKASVSLFRFIHDSIITLTLINGRNTCRNARPGRTPSKEGLW